MSHSPSEDQHLSARINFLRASNQLHVHYLELDRWLPGIHHPEFAEVARPGFTALGEELSRIAMSQPSRLVEVTSLPASLITDAFGDARYADFEIHCQNRIFRVHRLVVCKRSRYFETACEIDMMEKHSGIINLVEEDPNVIYRILRFMYTGQLALGQDPDGDECGALPDEAYDTPDESAAVMSDFVNRTTLLPTMDELDAANRAFLLDENHSDGEWVPPRDSLDYAELEAPIESELDKDEDKNEEGEDDTSELSDDAVLDVLYPVEADGWLDAVADEVGVWGSPNHFVNTREEEDDRVNDYEEDGVNAHQTQRLLNMVHLYAAADRLQVAELMQEISSIFREELDRMYFDDHPIAALQLAKEVYSTTPDANRGLRDTVLEVIKFESAKLVIHLKDTITELFKIVPQLAFDLFQDATITDRGDEVVQERHYRLYGSLSSEQ